MSWIKIAAFTLAFITLDALVDILMLILWTRHSGPRN